MSGFFITGSGTGVGKTYVTCRLVRELRKSGQAVRALKPVISGFDPGAIAESDTGMLLAAMGESLDEASVGAISPWRFAEPISPDMAAKHEGRRLNASEIATFCRYAAPGGEDGMLLVEGIGGVMVPLNERETVLDWMAALSWPSLLVVGSYLGTLSHTLTALSTIRAQGMIVAGIVVSESPESPVPLSETADTLRNFSEGIPVVALAHDAAPDGDPSLVDLLS